jgi:serpin B
MSDQLTVLSRSMADFAVELYKKASKDASKNDNVFLSPFSVSYALAMCYAGANTSTKNEMKKVLFGAEGGNLNDQAIHDSFAEIMTTLNNPKSAYKLAIANRLFAHEKYGSNLLQTFTDLLSKKYQSDLHLTNFGEQGGEVSRKKINDWVSDKTNQKIENLIAPGILDDDTRLVLVNAIYFKGDWLKKFDKDNTQKKPFYSAPDRELQVDMMHMYSKKFPYGETDEFQILGIPYEGHELAMFVLLPKEKYGLEKLESGLTGGKILDAIQNTRDTQVEVLALPKFKLLQQFNLSGALKELGAREMFEDNADFSNISGRRDLKVSEVIHKAFVEVNEEGTEAAAATAIEMVLCSMPIESETLNFIADHPFLFVIFDQRANSLLFVGKLNKVE